MAKAKRFEAKADPQPDDMIPVSLPRALVEEITAERDRVDAPQDALGRPRRQEGRDKFVERLVRFGLAISRKRVPDWRDDMDLEDL